MYNIEDAESLFVFLKLCEGYNIDKDDAKEIIDLFNGVDINNESEDSYIELYKKLKDFLNLCNELKVHKEEASKLFDALFEVDYMIPLKPVKVSTISDLINKVPLYTVAKGLNYLPVDGNTITYCTSINDVINNKEVHQLTSVDDFIEFSKEYLSIEFENKDIVYKLADELSKKSNNVD